MSSIFLCVGQCGNQLAKSLIDTLEMNEFLQCHKSYDGKYRFINIDSEIKIINRLRRSFKDKLRDENLLSTKFGRGNNWATGYKGLIKDNSDKFMDLCLESIRKEAENCDFLSNFVMLHSLSGGTGSGMGSKLVELLREEYSYNKLIFTCSIAPFKNGESALQHYNNLLSLSYLHEYTDCNFLFQNDDILRCLEETKSLEPTFDNFNDLIIRSFLGCTSPADHLTFKREASIGLELLELQRILCPNPYMKIIELVNLIEPSKSFFTSKLKSNSFQNELKNYAKINRFNKNYKTIGSICSLRGDDLNSNFNLFYSLDQYLKSMLNTVTWNMNTIDYWTSRNYLKLKNEKSQFSSINFAVNRTYCVEFLQETLVKAKLKYVNKAFLHWYQKYNVDELMFEQAFLNIDSIIDSYNEMAL